MNQRADRCVLPAGEQAEVALLERVHEFVDEPSGGAGERLARPERERLMLRAAMDEIASSAGITKPMLYRYFGSKEGLYAAYLRMTGDQLVESMRVHNTLGQSPQARFRAGLRAFLTYVEEHRTGWTVLHGETTAPADDQVAREVAELRARIVRMNTTVFRDEAFAHAFTGAAESLATWWVNQPEPSIDDAVATLMSIAKASTTTFSRSAG